MDLEKLTGEIYVDDISELVIDLNKNKNRFHSVKFDKRDGYYEFEILHEDKKDAKKLFKIIDQFLKKSKKGKVKREKKGKETDRGEKVWNIQSLED